MLYDSFFGKENNIAVATCGHSITLPQINLIKTLCNVDEIILAYDKQFQEIGDKDWQKLTKNFYAIHNKYGAYVQISYIFDMHNRLPFKAAPIDCGPDIFMELFKERIMI